MSRVGSCLWFNDDAEEAVLFYLDVFGDGKVVEKQPYVVKTPSELPVGSTMTADFELLGHSFVALNGGPHFTPNPSISFMVHRSSKQEISRLWERLADGGKVLMPLGEYPFSKWYGWVQDKYGFSWQLILPLVPEGEGNPRPPIVVSHLFSGDVCGKAQEAMQFYTSVFGDAKIGDVHRYGPGQEPNSPDSLMLGDFKLLGQWFACMDSALQHDFSFNEAVSHIVLCTDQEEINYYYDKLSAVPEAEMCGWLKDQYGVSWQLTTKEVNELVSDTQAMSALMDMKRLDLKALRQAKQ